MQPWKSSSPRALPKEVLVRWVLVQQDMLPRRKRAHFPQQDPGVCGIRNPEDTRTTESTFLGHWLPLVSNKV